MKPFLSVLAASSANNLCDCGYTHPISPVQESRTTMANNNHKPSPSDELSQNLTPQDASQPETLPTETVETSPAAEPPDVETLLKRLEEAETRAAEHLDGWQRTQAEFINYRNRVQRDAEAQRLAMKAEIFQKILPILDDLDLALQNQPANDPWASGIELIARKFHSVLAAEGVTRIEAEGKPFDPNFHEAISHEPHDTVESGHVIEVVRNGYMLGDRVIRPALVRVAQ